MKIKNYLNKSLYDFKSYEISKPMQRINLGSNESPFNLMEDEYFKSGYTEILSDLDLNRYPDPASSELRAEIANYVNVDSDNIIMGCGADEVINMILATFVNPGEIVITHSPSFEMYKISSKIVHAEIVEVEDREYEIDIDSIIEKANHLDAKIVFLCTPNNPTGYIIPADEVQRLIDNTKCIVVLDIAYIEFSDEQYSDLNLNERVIRLRTLSKAFGLASLRVGYAIADESIIRAINLVRPPYNLNELSQRLALFTVKNRDKIFKYIEKIKLEKNRFTKIITEMGYEVLPSSANFVLLKVENSKEFSEKLKSENIRIRTYSPESSLKDYYRISVGLPEENDEIIRLLRGD
ncbi:MAG: histidinol-phosphate transaminase [Tissierellia bacterium]|nr:histidinol-phosphate transaminase [Tissierellia bacterium]